MVDDKDESAPDPWAGIDDEGGGQGADGFTFSFDAGSDLGEQSAPLPSDLPPDPVSMDVFPPDVLAPDLVSPDLVSLDRTSLDRVPEDDQAPDSMADVDGDEAPIFAIEAAATPDADPFASLAIEAEAAADVADDISDWLSEPQGDGGAEPPLAVFAPEDPETEAGDVIAAESMFGVDQADDLHATPDAIPGGAVDSSHVEVGTGFSGVMSPSEVDPASGALPADEWPDALSEEASADAALDDFSADDQPSFEASGFDGVSDLGEPGMPGELQADEGGTPIDAPAAVAATAAVATTKAVRAAASGRKKGGGIGQVLGIVLGGLMAIPITYAILIWGFQKDPFKLAGMVPEQVAFLLPQKFQPGSKKPGAVKLDAASALDDLPSADAVAAAPVVDPAGEPAADDGEPKPAPDAATDALAALPAPVDVPGNTPIEPQEPAPEIPPPLPFEDLVSEAKQPVVAAAAPEPEPLDLSALEAAIGEATAAFDALAAAESDDPERKKLLVAWYKRLATAAEQLVLVEKLAADSGRGLGDASTAIDPLFAPLAADGTARAELAKLSGMWLASKKRPADGAILLATFEGARQVGPYWSMRVTVDGADPRSVAVISRAQPSAEPGERVLVTGVLFDGDVVWASDCRPLARKAAPVEDLF